MEQLSFEVSITFQVFQNYFFVSLQKKRHFMDGFFLDGF
jgi:hypothetical protein